MLKLDYDITDLRGAEYNPRRIDEAAIARLTESIERLGLVKPLIVRGKLLVAGHQRTKALRRLGIDRAPAFVLGKETTTYDEIRFNQLHNGTDMDIGDERVRITCDLSGVDGYTQVGPKAVTGNQRARGAVLRTEIANLILKYGPWGGVVATQSGEVIHCAQYALACAAVRKPLTVYVVPDARAEEYRAYLNRQYGEFSYDHLEKQTYIQTFAQMFRLRGGARDNRSPTYENLVIPWLARHREARVLDFGCGQGDYVRSLGKAGYRITGLEFFRRSEGRNAIDVNAVNRMVDQVVEEIATLGRYDAVVCDYVLNSVDSPQAEQDVLNCLDAFCKPGGMLFFAGRRRERVDEAMGFTKRVQTKRRARFIEFLDGNGFSALYRQGHWFYQRFHYEREVKELCQARGWKIHNETSGTGWQVQAVRTDERADPEALRASLAREFDLPVNKAGRRLGRAEDILRAFDGMLEKKAA